MQIVEFYIVNQLVCFFFFFSFLYLKEKIKRRETSLIYVIFAYKLSFEREEKFIVIFFE